MEKRVLVGLSGGLDSSVAAMLLKQHGYEVIGATMSIWDGEYSPLGGNACYGPDERDDIDEARKVAEFIGISYHVFDCAKEYKSTVLEYFRSDYLQGRTPNPCVKCNQLMKFGLLQELARKSGLEFDYFATGHYAQVIHKDGRYALKRAADARKDQTYFLYRLSQEQLKGVLFPLADFKKEEVREMARKAALPVAEKAESQDFYCGDYKELLQVEDKLGSIVLKKDNRILGQHNGFWNFTIGQRKGLGVAYSEPLYVVELKPNENLVVVGTREDVMSTSFIVDDLHWMLLTGIEGQMEVTVKIRSASREAEAVIEPFENKIKVTFNQPKDAITPGQSAVFYKNEVIVGGGVIENLYKQD